MTPTKTKDKTRPRRTDIENDTRDTTCDRRYTAEKLQNKKHDQIGTKLEKNKTEQKDNDSHRHTSIRQ